MHKIKNEKKCIKKDREGMSPGRNRGKGEKKKKSCRGGSSLYPKTFIWVM